MSGATNALRILQQSIQVLQRATHGTAQTVRRGAHVLPDSPSPDGKHGAPFMQQWQRDEIAKAEALDAMEIWK